MSRSSSSASSGSSRCVQCDRLRDELAMLKLQPHAATATAAASSSASAAAASPSAAASASATAAASAAPLPPLLYQLQRGVAPRQPSASPTRVVTAPVAAAAPKPKSSSAAATAKRPAVSKHAASTSAPPASSPRTASSVASSSQTSLDDVDPACVSFSEPICLRCPCCAILQARLAEMTSARDAAESALRQSQAAVKMHEGNVAGWQRSLKSMREQLAAAQSQMQQQQSKPPSALESELHAARMQLAEQDRLIRSLQEQRDADQRWIARMQEQLSGGAASASVSASASSSSASASSADGLSSVQREQLKLRMGAERALLKLQQLFPDQQIGGSGSVGDGAGGRAVR